MTLMVVVFAGITCILSCFFLFGGNPMKESIKELKGVFHSAVWKQSGGYIYKVWHWSSVLYVYVSLRSWTCFILSTSLVCQSNSTEHLMCVVKSTLKPHVCVTIRTRTRFILRMSLMIQSHASEHVACCQTACTVQQHATSWCTLPV